MLPPLDVLIQYKHPLVIRAYVRNHLGNQEEATCLFEEMLKYLWASTKHSKEKEKRPEDPALQFLFVMHQEMREIDNMWHNFILYTKDYAEFCQKYFGMFLHHEPDVADKIMQTQEEFSQEMEKYLSYVYDTLGEATVCRWFAPHV